MPEVENEEEDNFLSSVTSIAGRIQQLDSLVSDNSTDIGRNMLCRISYTHYCALTYSCEGWSSDQTIEDDGLANQYLKDPKII